MAGAKTFTVYTKFAVKNNFSGPVLSMAKGADKMAARLDSLKTGTANVAKGFGKFATVAAVGAAAAVAAGAAVFKLAQSSAAAADDILNTSNALGISTKALQEYRYVGIQAGLTTEEMDGALTKLTKNLGNGSGEVEEALQKIGVTAEQLKAAGPDKSLELIANGFKNVKDPTTKASVAMTLFGKSSVRMVNALESGEAGIAKLRGEAQEIGYVMGDEALENAGNLDDALDKLGATASGAASRLAQKMIPGVLRLTEGLQKGLAPGGALAGIIEKLGSAGGSIGDMLGPAFERILAYIPKIIGYAETLWNALKPVVGPILAMIEPILKIVDNLMPVVIGAIQFAAKILEPFLIVIKTLLDGLAYITGGGPQLATAGAAAQSKVQEIAQTDAGRQGLARAGMVPMSPAAGTMTRESYSTSRVDITVGNLPAGSTVKQDKPAPGVTINTGRTVGGGR